MTQTRAGALAALETRISNAMKAANVGFYRNPENAVDANDAGVVIMTDGTPGEPEVILSPRRYSWDHDAEFEITAKGSNRDAVVESIIALFEPALATDRTFGGAVDYAAIDNAPDITEYNVDGAETERSAVLRVTLCYVTASGAG